MCGPNVIGIAIVVDDIHKGCKLAFRYPGVPSFKISDFHAMDAGLFAKMFRPKNRLCNSIFELRIDHLRFVSYPITLISSEKDKETTMFNVVLALVDDGSVSNEGLNGIRVAVTQIAMTLKHEQIRKGFVTNEVKILLNNEDEVVNHRKEMDGFLDTQTLIDLALVKSILAINLKDIYHGLKKGQRVQVEVNRWIQLSLMVEEKKDEVRKPMRPYHTLLLLGDEDRIIESLPKDSSKQLKKVIAAANPLRSFQDLSICLGISLSQLYRLAAHLVYWGLGRIISTVTKHGMYQVRTNVTLHLQSPMASEFKRKFAPNELHEVLSSFSSTRRLGEYLKKLNADEQMDFIRILIWLLQRDYIYQLHRYVNLRIDPEDGKNNTDTIQHTGSALLKYQRSRQLDANAEKQTPTIELTDYEKEHIQHLPAHGNALALFKKLCVYFRGQHHLEEIMWRENITRSELRSVLSAYGNIAICCMHE